MFPNFSDRISRRLIISGIMLLGIACIIPAKDHFAINSNLVGFLPVVTLACPIFHDLSGIREIREIHGQILNRSRKGATCCGSVADHVTG
jgi:hypothetical protein